VALTVVLTWPAGRSDERAVERTTGAVRLPYRVEPSGAAAAEEAAQVMRARLAAAGIEDAHVSASSAGLAISAPAAARADVTALTQQGRLAIYDFERSVIGGTAADPPRPVAKAEAEARAAGKPGATVVRAERNAGDGWHALGGTPALTAADVESAGAGVDEMTGEPIVAIELTTDGQRAFSELTREIARRGSAQAEPGDDPLEVSQHFAIVIDDRIVSVPFIHFREVPDGIDGADGMQISGDLTPQTARRLATILDTGPLPATLVPG
jgi:preprotein translocase subunit SecD